MGLGHKINEGKTSAMHFVCQEMPERHEAKTVMFSRQWLSVTGFNDMYLYSQAKKWLLLLHL